MPASLRGNQPAGFFTRLSPAVAGVIKQYAAHGAPHALLISGSFGTGKSTLASLLAGALLCEGQERPCNVCEACVKAEKGSHTNLMVVRTAPKQRSVKVEQARALLASLATYPFSSGPRVVVLELADIFTPQAQNALLKAIEEPDAATYFLLTCQNEHGVLSTIRSRCQTLRLPPWEEALLLEALTWHGVPMDEAKGLVPLALGSPGKALQIRQDPGFWAVKKLADETFLSMNSLAVFPEASIRLKDAKDKANALLDYLENAALALPKKTSRENARLAKALLSGVSKARQQQASNLSWQAIADHLLLHLLKETI